MVLRKIIQGLLVLLFLCMFSAIKTLAYDDAETKTIKLKCTEMTCSGCKKKITKSINNLEGVKEVNVDLDTKIITVTFDESMTNAGKIVEAIAEAGYESELIE